MRFRDNWKHELLINNIYDSILSDLHAYKTLNISFNKNGLSLRIQLSYTYKNLISYLGGSVMTLLCTFDMLYTY